MSTVPTVRLVLPLPAERTPRLLLAAPRFVAGPPGSPGEGGEAVRFTEARHDLEQARQEVTRNLEYLNSLSASNQAVAAEVIDETRALSRLLEAVDKLLSKGQLVPQGQAISVTVRVELVQDAARQADEHADAELKGILKEVLDGGPKVARKLLNMNLHLFPVKEWKLGGELSVGIAKGTIEVTFGRGT